MDASKPVEIKTETVASVGKVVTRESLGGGLVRCVAKWPVTGTLMIVG